MHGFRAFQNQLSLSGGSALEDVKSPYSSSLHWKFFPRKDSADLYYRVRFHNTALLLISIFENPFEIGTGKRLKAPPLRTSHVYKVNKGADVMKAVCAERAATALRGRGF